MKILSILILLFGIFALSRVILRFRSKEIKYGEMLFWTAIWLSVLALVLFPEISVDLARLLGVGRGADTAFFVSILLLYYLVFRLYVKIEKVDKDLTRLAIEISKELHKKSKDKEK